MLHRVNQYRGINGESYRAGEVIDIDPTAPTWLPWIESRVLTPVSSAGAVGSVVAPEAATGPTDPPEYHRFDGKLVERVANESPPTQPEGVSAPSDGT